MDFGATSPARARNRTNRLMLLVFGTGAAIGLESGMNFLFFSHSLWPLFVALGFSLLYSAVSYGLWRWGFPALRPRRFAAELAAHAVVSVVVFGAVGLGASWVLLRAFGSPPPPPQLGGLFAERTATWSLAMRLVPIFPIVLMSLIGYHASWKQIVTLRDRERELADLAATAQLAALRAQVNPHFLFNSLNSIAQLIHVDPEQAETCVHRLADIFRYVLRRQDQEFVSFGEELEIVQAYLEIERARFGDRLRVETTIDPRSLRHPIPNLTLQPLVENAVKHGLAAKIGPGTVRIDARVEGTDLILSVDDDGRGMERLALATLYDRGVGLRNLRSRLERLYGAAHLPDIRSTPEGGTCVTLRVPAGPVGAA